MFDKHVGCFVCGIEDKTMNRREFFKRTGLLVGCLAIDGLVPKEKPKESHAIAFKPDRDYTGTIRFYSTVDNKTWTRCDYIDRGDGRYDVNFDGKLESQIT